MRNWISRLILLVVSLGLSNMLSAMPILSSDGSKLTGLDVNGTIYDVNFRDGIVEQIFPMDQVTAPGWYDLARSVSLALFEALDGMSFNDNDFINGCEDNPGIPGFLGPNLCIIVTPDTFDAPDTWRADNVVVVNENGTFYAPPPYNAGIFGYADTSTPNLSYLTLATFAEARSSVPVPGTLILLVTGFLLVTGRASAAKRLRGKVSFSQ